MKITNDDKKVTIDLATKSYTAPLGSIIYEKTNNGITLLVGHNSFTANFSHITVNGVQATADNADELLKTLFKLGNGGGVSLPIEIADVNNLQTDLDKKADLVDGKVPSSQLPSFVDDVIEGALNNNTEFEVEGLIITPESGKLYTDIITNKIYRWSGSKYSEVSPSIGLGETVNTAYRGDRGKIAYDHSQLTSSNPHNVTKADVGLSNADNTADLNKPVSTAQATAIKKAVSDIQVGGVNLLNNTSYLSDLRQKKFGFPSIDWFNEHLGQSVTLSCYIHLEDAVLTGVKKVGVEFCLVQEDSTETFISCFVPVADGTTESKRIHRTVALPSKKVTAIKYDGTYILDYQSGVVQVGYPQMELGNKATDWSLSNADILNINKRLTDLQIGSRNYFFDKVWKSYWTRIGPDSGTNTVENGLLKLTSGTGSSGFITFINKFITEKDFIDGEDCIISFEIKADEDDLDFSLYFNSYNGVFNKKTTQTWKEYSFSFNYKYDSDLKLSIHKLTSGSKVYYVRNIKLEKGDKPTGWSIAPEDIQTKFTELSNRLTALGG